MDIGNLGGGSWKEKGGKREADADVRTGNLMLAIQARSFNNYIYLQNTNINHPARYIPNRVTGILFENKVEYASTYLLTFLLHFSWTRQTTYHFHSVLRFHPFLHPRHPHGPH